MSFKADHNSISRLGEQLDQLAGDANKAVGYVEDWLSYGHGEGRIYITAVNAAEDAKAALTNNYSHLKEIQRKAAVEVDNAARLYQRTDHDEAARLDRTHR